MTLPVWYQQLRVGTLESTPDDRFAFSYASDWLGRADAFAISLSLPLSGETIIGGAAHAFFANLLPEGNVRALVARRLGLSVDNDYAMLERIGGECAGALVIGDAPAGQGYRDVGISELDAWNQSGRPLAEVSGHDGIRLSLAGAQHKLPVRITGGTMSLPIGADPTTHIVKFASRDFAHLPENEALVTMLARSLKLPTCDIDLRQLPSGRVLVATRYDRPVGTDGVIDRLHQEDLCQALGVGPRRKYEAEGGPAFADCYHAVVHNSSEPLPDGRALLRWLAFNAVIGNADGHAKNLSLLRRADGNLRLAPFYDLVCTRAYKGVERKLAMSVGNSADPGQLRRQDWRALARAIGVGSRFLIDLVRATASDVLANLADTATAFRSRYGDSPALQMVVPRARRQARRTLTLLAE